MKAAVSYCLTVVRSVLSTQIIQEELLIKAATLFNKVHHAKPQSKGVF
jgi:hypothetical protein